MHHPTNAGVITAAKPKAAASRTHFYQGAHLRTKQYERAVLTFPRVHSITQVVGDSAVIVSCDQESELLSSLEAPCKKPYCRSEGTSPTRVSSDTAIPAITQR